MEVQSGYIIWVESPSDEREEESAYTKFVHLCESVACALSCASLMVLFSLVADIINILNCFSALTLMTRNVIFSSLLLVVFIIIIVFVSSFTVIVIINS